MTTSSRRIPPTHPDPASELRANHPDATFLRILGVNYFHLRTPDGGDMYLTEYGVPFFRHLLPDNWYEPVWFKQKRIRLCGTGTVYKVPTKPIDNHVTPSIDLAIKWSRVGQDIPLDTFTLYKNINAEFNTPFEEFGMLEELRRGEYGPRDVQIMTQKPLGIYVPSERMQLWQTGRSRDKILARITRRPGVEIDILRSYILIYGWIDGVDAPEAVAWCGYEPEEQRKILHAIARSVHDELEMKGFMVADHKPTHIILRLKNNQIMQRLKGRITYAIVDYELLARTDEHEDAVRTAARSQYLTRQRDRFLPRPASAFPAEQKPARVMNVPYVYGHCESTNGLLWVVGNDPELFSYFLPERWRKKQVPLTDDGQTFYTQTKDRIHLVWRISRVGELPAPPSGDPSDQHYQRVCLHGFNSPFEEIALALEMQERGILTTYPRAIYMTGSSGEVITPVLDERRFEQLRETLSPEGKTILPVDHDYITLWGYWRGVDDNDAVIDAMPWTPIDASLAVAKGIITKDLYQTIMLRHRQRLAAAGFEDLNLRGDHVLLSYIPDGPLKSDATGFPEHRHSNFELVRRIG